MNNGYETRELLYLVDTRLKHEIGAFEPKINASRSTDEDEIPTAKL